MLKIFAAPIVLAMILAVLAERGHKWQNLLLGALFCIDGALLTFDYFLVREWYKWAH